ncbi:MAG: GNAT family N-acetyltransferase, partial [Candidatus Omnitrophica bacterium]|nr:GNAT family N-acetyltransferase [Candidatus Omnitrophota bacterium]
TLYELARIGVPSLGVCVADNQRRNLQEWQKLGFLENLGEYDDPSLFERLASSMAKLDAFEIRRKMSDCGKALVDGKGSTRVVKMLMSSLLKKAFSIRDAISKDASCIFQISNDDTVRSNSFHPEKITWDKHLEWFTKRLNDNNCEFFVAELNGEIYGQVRFDIDENKNEASVSISVKEDIRGLGMGVYMLDEAVDILNRKRRDIRLIKAYIKGENMRSAAVFEKAGFSYAGRTDINGQNAKIYTKEILSAEVQKT